MTAQEVFDAVVRHAAQMPGPSLAPQDAPDGRGPRCLYRAPDGNACFIGGLLTDTEAHSFDALANGNSVVELHRRKLLPTRLSHVNVNLLVDLQLVHDRGTMSGHSQQHHWPKRLVKVANDHGLDTSVVAQAFTKTDLGRVTTIYTEDEA